MAVNGGLFNYTGKSVGDTQNTIDAEQELSNGRIKVGNTRKATFYNRKSKITKFKTKNML